MNDAFQNISEEKQQRVLNAAMEVFAKHGYKRASTAEIASKAGISKGLLFHYFDTKETLYFYLYDVGVNIIMEEIRSNKDIQTNDFFEKMNATTAAKMQSMRRHPYIYSFFVKVYIEEDESIKGELTRRLQALVQNQTLLTDDIDMTPFRKPVDITLLSNMIVNFAVEFLQARLLMAPDTDMNILIHEFQKYLDMLKENFYKEEYL